MKIEALDANRISIKRGSGKSKYRENTVKYEFRLTIDESKPLDELAKEFVADPIIAEILSRDEIFDIKKLFIKADLPRISVAGFVLMILHNIREITNHEYFGKLNCVPDVIVIDSKIDVLENAGSTSNLICINSTIKTMKDYFIITSIHSNFGTNAFSEQELHWITTPFSWVEVLGKWRVKYGMTVNCFVVLPEGYKHKQPTKFEYSLLEEAQKNIFRFKLKRIQEGNFDWR